MGAFGSPPDEKIGIMKKIFLHIDNIFLSFVFWGLIINVIQGK
jgi:hypothetical protein